MATVARPTAVYENTFKSRENNLCRSNMSSFQIKYDDNG